MTLLQRILKAGATLVLAALPAIPQAFSPAHAQDPPQPRQERKDDRKYFLYGTEVGREQYRTYVAGQAEEALKDQYEWDGAQNPEDLADKVRTFRTAKHVTLPLAGLPPLEFEVLPFDKTVMDEVLVQYARAQALDGKPRHAYQMLEAMEHPAPGAVVDMALDDLLKTPEKISGWQDINEITTYWRAEKGAGDITKGTTADRLAVIARRCLQSTNDVEEAYKLRDIIKDGFKADPAVLDDAFIEQAQKWAYSHVQAAAAILDRIGHKDPTSVIDPVIDKNFENPGHSVGDPQALMAYWTERKGKGDITKGTTAERVLTLARLQANTNAVDHALVLYRILKERFKADPSSLDGKLTEHAQQRAQYGAPHGAYEILKTIGHPAPEQLIDPLLERFLDATGNTSHAHIVYVLRYWRDDKGKGDITKGTTAHQALKLLRRSWDASSDEALKVYAVLRDDFKGRRQVAFPLPPAFQATLELPIDLKPAYDRLVEYGKQRANWSFPDEAYDVLLAIRHPEPEKLIDATIDELLKEGRIQGWNANRFIAYWGRKGGGSIEKGTTAENILRLAETMLQQNRQEMAGPYYTLVLEKFTSIPAERRAAMIFRTHYLAMLRPHKDSTEFHAMLNAYSSAENMLGQHNIPYPPVAEQQRIIREGLERLKGLSYRKPDDEETIKDAVTPLYDFFLVKPYLETREQPPKPEWLAEYGSKCLRRKSRQADALAALAWAYRLAGTPGILPKDTERYAHDALSNSKDASLDDILTLLAARKDLPTDAVLRQVIEQRLKSGDLANAARGTAALKDTLAKRGFLQEVYQAWHALDPTARPGRAVPLLPALSYNGSDMLLYFAHLAAEEGHREVASAAYRLAHHAAPEGGPKTEYLIGNDTTRHELDRKGYFRAWVNVGEGRPWDKDDEDTGKKNALYQDVLAEYRRR